MAGGKSSFFSQLRWGAVSTIIGGLLIYLTVGTIYSFGNMAPYVVSYMRIREVTPDLSYETASYILAMGKFVQGFGIWVGGHLDSRIGMRWTTLAGILIFSMSFVISYWAIQISFLFLLFTYGVLFGLGFGIAYIPPMICVMKWLPHSKGAANGILVAGIGAGSLIFNFVQTGFINPQNLAPDVRIDDGVSVDVYYSQDSILDRVPLSFLLQGGIFLVIELVGLCLLRNPPMESTQNKNTGSGEKTGLLTTSLSESTAASRHDKETYDTMRESIEGHLESEESSGYFKEVRPVEGRQADKGPAENGATPMPEPAISSSSQTSHPSLLRERYVDSSAVGSRLDLVADELGEGSDGSTGLAAHGDEDAKWSGKTVTGRQIFKQVFYWQMSINVFLDGIALLLVTALYKAYGQTFIPDDFFLAAVGSVSSVLNSVGRIFWGSVADKFGVKISFILVSGIMAIFTLTLPLTPYGGKAMFLIWVSVIFFGIGGLFSIAPTATSRAFGSTAFGQNYGCVFFLGVSVSALVGSFIQSMLAGHLSWDSLFVVCGSLPAIGVIISITMNVKTPDGRDI